MATATLAEKFTLHMMLQLLWLGLLPDNFTGDSYEELRDSTSLERIFLFKFCNELQKLDKYRYPNLREAASEIYFDIGQPVPLSDQANDAHSGLRFLGLIRYPLGLWANGRRFALCHPNLIRSLKASYLALLTPEEVAYMQQQSNEFRSKLLRR